MIKSYDSTLNYLTEFDITTKRKNDIVSCEKSFTNDIVRDDANDIVGV